MSKGAFVISLDTELAWGRIGNPDLRYFMEQFKHTREAVDRLLALFDQYQMPVTWAVLGRLLKKSVTASDHFLDDISYYYPSLSNEKVYENEKLHSAEHSYLFYNEVVEKIKSAKVKHEIGTHTYNHVEFGSFAASEEQKIKNDLEAVLASSSQYHLEMKSLVFPKNSVGFLSLLPKYQIETFRSPNQFWYSSFPGSLPRWIRKFDDFLPIAFRGVDAGINSHGLVEIPGSVFFHIQHRGIKKYIPFKILILKTTKGLTRAAVQGKIFHLWFHPYNFGYRMEEHLQALEAVLKCAVQLKEKGQLEFLTMQGVREKLTKTYAK